MCTCADILKHFTPIRSVNVSAWVGLRDLFNPIHHGGLKKFQPNPIYHRVQPNLRKSGWTHGWTTFFF